MLRSLITAALEYRLVVLLLAAALLAGGGLAIGEAPWDVFPEFAPPQVVVQTEAPGLSTEEVERLVTVPLESAVNGVSRLRTIRSSSVPGLSVITAIFEDGTPILDARQLVSERLRAAEPQLPDGVLPPQMTPLAASTSRLAMVGLTSAKLPLIELRTWADWTFQRRLQAVSGVAKVEVFGGEVKQYQVLVAPEKLHEYHLTLDQVTAAARNATAFGGAGFVETENQRLPIQQRTRIESPADLAVVPVVFQGGVAVTLGRVADVKLGAADKVGDATIDGQQGVLLVIHKQPFFNTLAVSASVDRALDELQSALPPEVTLHRGLFRQATFIERAIENLSLAILVGCLLVTLVLAAFLFQWRTVAISLTAIPLSLLGAILALRAFGASLNAMTLGGLAIALGEVVDDAIVDVENVLRRLKENRRSPQPRAALAVVLDASLEVRGAVVYASFIVMLVFLPVFFLEGLAGTFFRPLGCAYIAAILASLVVALTVTPAMCLILLRNAAPATAREPFVARRCRRHYGALLPIALRYPIVTLLAAGGLLASAAAALPYLGGEFLPEFRESNFVVFMAGKPDSSLVESVRVGRRVAGAILATPGVRSVAQQIGRAELSEDTWAPNISEVWVTLEADADYRAVLAELRGKLDGLPGYSVQIKQFLRERIDEVLSGTTADIVVRIVGDDLAVLRRQAASAAEVIRLVAGVEDLRIEQQVDVPQIEALLKPQTASIYGFSVGELNRAIQTSLRGATVGQVYEHDRVFDVVVRATPENRASPHALGRLLIDSPNQEKIPLSAVAAIDVVEAPNQINHDAARRRLLVTCNAEGRDVASVVADIKGRLRERVRLPQGYHFEFGGEHQARQEAQWRLVGWSAASLMGIFVFLYLDLKRVALTLLVMSSVPLACVGGVIAVFTGGGNVSLGSLVGFVTVFGIAVRNGILLVSHYQHLERVEGVAAGAALIVRGSIERVTPILMTAATTALGLLPLIVFGERPGNEIEHPMAIVILGGLLSSTFLTLFVLPVLYARFGTVKCYTALGARKRLPGS